MSKLRYSTLAEPCAVMTCEMVWLPNQKRKVKNKKEKRKLKNKFKKKYWQSQQWRKLTIVKVSSYCRTNLKQAAKKPPSYINLGNV